MFRTRNGLRTFGGIFSETESEPMTLEELKKLEPLFGERYIESIVARGKSSVVYRVSSPDASGQSLALKVVRFPQSEQELTRAMNSGKYTDVAAYLDFVESTVRENMDKMMFLRANKNIVRFDNYEIVREEGAVNVLILMELLTPLSGYLSKEKCTCAEVSKLGLDLCGALEGFRSVGVIHREIMPENIFVDPFGNYRLGDFGLYAAPNADSGKFTDAAYLAPEVIKGTFADTAGDIYSLGLVMYKLLNNSRTPFLPEFPAPISLSDREAAFEKRLRGDMFQKPSGADVPLSRIIFKATAYKPQDRFQTPAEFKTDLESYINYLNSPNYSKDGAVPSVQTVRNFRIAEDGDIAFSTYNEKAPDISKTSSEKEQFKEAFSDSDEDAEEEKKAANKKMYILIAVLGGAFRCAFGRALGSALRDWSRGCCLF